MKQYLLFLGAFFIAVLGVQAQQDAHFSQFIFAKQYINPGYTGIEGVMRGTVIHRSQWAGYSGADGGGAPQTQLFSVTYPFKTAGSPLVNNGVGMDLTYDQLGPVKNLNLKLNYSYHLRFANGAVLGMGLYAGFLSQQIDRSILRPIDQDDATINALGEREFTPDFGLGFWYESKRYFAGISMSHINRSSFTYVNEANEASSEMRRHMYITGGYNIQLGPMIELTPSVLVETDFSETSFSYGAIASYNRYKYWGGLYVRQSVVNNPVGASGKKLSNDDVTIMLGVGLLDQNALRVGYALDVVTSGVDGKSHTSHEIMISYVFPFGVDVKTPPLRTPRYRHEN